MTSVYPYKLLLLLFFNADMAIGQLQNIYNYRQTFDFIV